MEEKKQVHAFFSGKVQKVGFRWWCKYYAESHRLDGWVRNLPDKRVELLVEGNSDLVDWLIARLHEQFEISSAEIKEGPFEGEIGYFDITHPGNP